MIDLNFFYSTLQSIFAKYCVYVICEMIYFYFEVTLIKNYSI